MEFSVVVNEVGSEKSEHFNSASSSSCVISEVIMLGSAVFSSGS